MKAVIINNTIIYYPAGKIGNYDAEQFEYELLRIIDEYDDCDLIINMKDVPSISSKAIAVLISISQIMTSQKRSLSICDARDLVMKTISILNIDSLIGVYQTEQQVIEPVFHAI